MLENYNCHTCNDFGYYRKRIPLKVNEMETVEYEGETIQIMSRFQITPCPDCNPDWINKNKHY